ncbi:MAG: hypothetical protein QNJ54_13975 [Prochloraceae cyanobacterium]|nr:hypothetical protein [Prochloraceae cyanobacterium]
MAKEVGIEAKSFYALTLLFCRNIPLLAIGSRTILRNYAKKTATNFPCRGASGTAAHKRRQGACVGF